MQLKQQFLQTLEDVLLCQVFLTISVSAEWKLNVNGTGEQANNDNVRSLRVQAIKFMIGW